MATFDYKAFDSHGRGRKGSLSAANERVAKLELQGRGLTPISIAQATETGAAPSLRRLFGPRLTPKRLALVTRQLATLIAVAPLEEALRTIAAQADRPVVREVLSGVHSTVLEGYRLSEAMRRQGRSFPPLYRAMVAAGESSGSLPDILERLADLLENEQATRAKVVTAMVYPLALAAIAVLVVIALMTFVIPKVVDQFDAMGQTLPWLTRAIISVSSLMRDWWWTAPIVLPAGGWAFSRALERPAFRLQVDGLILRVPGLGRLVRDLHAARLARTLSTMIASGLPILEGLMITTPTIRNTVLRQATEEVATTIREGGSLSTALRRADVFPPLLVYMSASGESSGRVEQMLARAADYLEREFNAFTAVALSLLEPAIIIVMGAVVAVIVLSILLPILQINSLAFG